MKTSLVELNVIGDERGSLIALESGSNIEFDIRRCYYIFDTKSGVRRGFHAHKSLRQLLVCVSGSCKIFLDDGVETREYCLNSPSLGLYVTGLVWREMYDFSEGCVLMVLADQYYDESDYVRNYREFLQMANRG